MDNYHCSYPNKNTIETANRFQLCFWYRFLESPNTPEEIELMDLIIKKFNEFGGFTPEISETINYIIKTYGK